MTTPRIDFNGCQLLTSARSPFARRVRLAFRENGIRFEEKFVDVLKPNPEVNALNPVGRVPTVILPGGEVIFESTLILQALYESIQSPLDPRSPSDRVTAFRWSATAIGLAEKTVEYFFEGLKPEAARDRELLTEIEEIFERSLRSFESFIGTRDAILAGLSQADLDMGTALRYMLLRHPMQWRERFPKTSAYLERLETRPSFKDTHPPAPAH